MDDYSISSLNESKNEWCARLVTILTPAINDGLISIFNESSQLCIDNNEKNKYLMTFQNFLTRIPKWNDNIISEETLRIEKASKCGYLEDLISCVHIIQLKTLTCIRVGQKQKQIDIDIPSKTMFIHKVYINVARKLYKTAYLFETEIPPLQKQKYNRELELIIKEGIMETIRETMPIEDILRAYMGDSEEIIEEFVNENVTQDTASKDNTPASENANTTETTLSANSVPSSNDKILNSIETTSSSPNESVLETAQIVINKEPETVAPEIKTTTEIEEINKSKKLDNNKNVTLSVSADEKETISISNENPIIPTINLSNIEESKDKSKIDSDIKLNDTPSTINNLEINNSLTFSDNDTAFDTQGSQTTISAPKDIERLEKISIKNSEKRKREEEEEEEEEGGDERIQIGEPISLNVNDIDNLNASINNVSDNVLSEIELLE